MTAIANDFNSVPDNIILEIFTYLPVKELCLVGRVCRRWRRIARDNSLWKHVDLRPYRLNLMKTWKVIRSHFSECLISLQLKGDTDRIKEKNPVSDAMLNDLKERCPNIRDLGLYNCNLQNLEMKLPVTLTSLKVIQCHWKPRWLRDIHKSIPSLNSLVLEHTTRIDNHDIEDIVKIVHLKVLNLNACYRINEKGLTKIATELKELQVLEIAHCNCSDLVLHHVSRNLTALETLNVRGGDVTDSSISTVVQALTHLKHLNIHKCNLLTPSGLECLLSLKLSTLVCNSSHVTSSMESSLEANGCVVTTLPPT